MQADDIIEGVAKAIKSLDDLKKPNEWMLVSPTGEVWKGSVEQMARVAMVRSDIALITKAPTGGES